MSSEQPTDSQAQRDAYFMQQAMVEAQAAEAIGEVPVGAVAVYQDEIIARGHNRVITDLDPSAHAEMVTLRAAAAALGNYRLGNVTLYVTLEPCSMCAGLLVHSRIKRLVYAAHDPKAGAAGSVLNITQHPQLNHHIELTQNVHAEACATLLSTFFKQRRAAKKRLRQQQS